MSKPTNKQRAEWALNALKVFVAETGVDPEDAIADLICNLGHLSERMTNLGLYHEAVARGIAHYNFEFDEDRLADPAQSELLEMPEVTITVKYRDMTLAYERT